MYNVIDKQKLLIYSDCYLFGGSERLISSIVRSNNIREKYNVVFAFRSHKIYKRGLKDVYKTDEDKSVLRPLIILCNSNIYNKIDHLNINKFISRLFKAPFLLMELVGVYFLFNFIVQVFFLIKNSPNIIHINNGGYPGANSCTTMVYAAKFLKIPSIVYQINNIATKTNNPIRKFIDRFVDTSVVFFIIASKHAKESLIKNRMFNKDKIVQVLNTISVEPIQKSRRSLCEENDIDEGNFILCNIGFLSKRKGQKYLLQALNIIRIKEPLIFKKISLILIGNGEEEMFLRDYAESKFMSENIKFLGYRNNFEDYINCCDLFVFPSIAGEDMPLVILSAMRLGKTILATDFSGIGEEIENEISGILLSPEIDFLSENLTAKILQVYNNRDSKLGENAKNRFNNLFSNTVYVNSILELYKTVSNLNG